MNKSTDPYERAKDLIRVVKERDPDSDAGREAFGIIRDLLLRLDEENSHPKSPGHFGPRWGLVIKTYVREMTDDRTPSKLRREMVSRLTLSLVHAIGPEASKQFS